MLSPQLLKARKHSCRGAGAGPAGGTIQLFQHGLPDAACQLKGVKLISPPAGKPSANRRQLWSSPELTNTLSPFSKVAWEVWDKAGLAAEDEDLAQGVGWGLPQGGVCVDDLLAHRVSLPVTRHIFSDFGLLCISPRR